MGSVSFLKADKLTLWRPIGCTAKKSQSSDFNMIWNTNQRSCQGLTEVVNSRFPTEASFAGGRLGRAMQQVLGQSRFSWPGCLLCWGLQKGWVHTDLAHPPSNLGIIVFSLVSVYREQTPLSFLLLLRALWRTERFTVMNCLEDSCQSQLTPWVPQTVATPTFFFG